MISSTLVVLYALMSATVVNVLLCIDDADYGKRSFDPNRELKILLVGLAWPLYSVHLFVKLIKRNK